MVERWLEGRGAGICCPFFDAEGFVHFVCEGTGEIFSVDKNKEVIW